VTQQFQKLSACKQMSPQHTTVEPKPGLPWIWISMDIVLSHLLIKLNI